MPGSKRSTSTLRSETVDFAGSTIHTAGERPCWVSALAGIETPAPPPARGLVLLAGAALATAAVSLALGLASIRGGW